MRFLFMEQYYRFVFKKLQMEEHYHVSMEITFANYEFYYNFFRLQSFNTYEISNNTYYKIFNVKIFDEKLRSIYKISINKKTYMLLFYNKAKKTIYVEGIIYNMCATNACNQSLCVGILLNPIGKKLFKFVIRYIKKLKHIDRIELKSRTFNIYNKKNIYLCPTHMILYGETMLERMGFTQYDQSNEIIIAKRFRNKNKNIIRNKKVKDIETSLKKGLKRVKLIDSGVEMIQEEKRKRENDVT